MEIGEHVRAARKRAGLSQEALARRADMSLSAITTIELGTRADPHYSSLSKIAGALGMSVGELLEEGPVLAGKAEAPAETGRSEESAEARESVDYRKLHLELGDRLIGQLKETLAMLADVLPTDDYAEFVKYPFEEQRWRIETAERLNALAEKIIESIKDEEATLTLERRDELAERRRELDAASVVVKEFRKAS